jgi:hypothetical protein
MIIVETLRVVRQEREIGFSIRDPLDVQREFTGVIVTPHG